MASLERVLYAQMLVLFAPAATPAASHLPLLLTTLQSRQPALRRAAADTLRHLAGVLLESNFLTCHVPVILERSP